MQSPQVIIDHIQVNIKVPQQLHIVNPSPHRKQKPTQQQQQIQPITESPQEQINSSPHKIRHIESIDDKGEFIDEHRQSRVSDKDELNETINRISYPEIELPLDEETLEKIVEEEKDEEADLKQLKHLNIQKDKDEFGIGLGKDEKSEKRKRRLSESNISSYAEVKNQFSLAEYLKQQQKLIPERIEKIMEQQLEGQKKQGFDASPLRRSRKKSVHSVHCGSSPSVSQQFKRMIVDELDKKKKSPLHRNNSKMDEQLPENRMQEIKEQKQEQQTVNTFGLEMAREKMEQQWIGLAKAVGHQIGPDSKEVFVLYKKPTIPEDDKEEKDQ